ncbi:lysine--tRNA ligase [Clostridium argentinense CDC 2741]|uniref:Lysine--tRNA ligase n=1 Tax=Clostridium argentinense CDC 2741 TaxID=1418104 RepID=A0A0C1QXW9_9CLOT|nr:lysine--tRNA ligase [Clostridium argentinense]ARC83505.1 lysine--tRNA ligase [Clostridium argentinense]KIE45852.1 lysine--tRNA ligase [Clostridium argentinense CDC 2741]NFF39047.1 lysine--tRNA ligase [Clostridium argentinense]NFP49459.1 lysine--tRNA ligase [Clostridium argentinense]NFP74179.1 lysine--tRNA ligase [Clostridium argentinense]
MFRNYENIEDLREIMNDANEFVVERVKKLNELIERGINPYPYSFKECVYSNYIIDNFHDIKEEEVFTLSGRIMLLRRMGNATFLNLRDQEGDIQVYLNKGALGNERYNLLKLIDTGDIIGVEGTVFKTKTGEITIKASEFTILSKSIRPLPEKYHGIQDMDLRQRHRSLDMIMNSEVKERFIKRSRALSYIREFMNSIGFFEMETPILDTKYGGGEAKPFVTYVNALSSDVYMNVSPELYLKRLMVGGVDRVYTIGRSFRNEGIDRTHYPEFTLFECYMAYADYTDMMRLMENLYEYVFTKVNGTTKSVYDGVEIDFKAPWRRARMCDLVKEDTGIDVEFLSREEIVKIVEERELLSEEALEGLDIKDMTKGDLIMTIFDEYSASKLVEPTFVIDFPVETSPLCKVHRKNSELIERFEPYAYGVELGNAYSELNDALRQRVLLHDQADKLRAGLETASPMDEEFAVAIDVGMPPAGGLGIGIDRMIMFLTGSNSIKDVIAFPLVKR